MSLILILSPLAKSRSFVLATNKRESRDKLDKSIDRPNERFLWFQVTQFKAPTSPSPQNKQQLMPLNEIYVVRDLKDLPEGFEALNEPLVSAENGCMCD